MTAKSYILSQTSESGITLIFIFGRAGAKKRRLFLGEKFSILNIYNKYI